MKEHPVPQQISAFQFKLFGNLTLRQFMFVGAAGLLAWFLIFTIKQPIISFPLAIIIFSLGLSIAIVPFQGRPLDQWFFIMISSLLSPTLRVYRKDQEIPDFLKSQPVEKVEPQLTSFAQTEKKLLLEEYLEKYAPKSKNNLDLVEERRLASLKFDSKSVPTIPNQPISEIQSPLWGFGGKEIVEDGNFKLASSVNFGAQKIIAFKNNQNQTTYLPEIGQMRARKLGEQTSDRPTLLPLNQRVISIEPDSQKTPTDIFEYTPQKPTPSFIQDQPALVGPPPKEPSVQNQNENLNQKQDQSLKPTPSFVPD